MSAMMFSSPMSARFIQSGPDPQEIPSSSSSTSMSASTSASTSTAYEFGVEMGIIPSATMLPAPVQVQAPIQYPSIPFVSARARISEFERLREEIRETEMVREQQVERLHALTSEVSHGLDVPQFNGPQIPTASIPIPQSVYRMVPEPFPSAGMPIDGSFHLQVDHFNQYQAYHIPTSIPASVTAPMPIPHPHHHQQRQQLPYVRVGSPSLIARGRVSKACENCKFRKVKCSGMSPCERCTDRALQCIYRERKVRGPTKKRREKRDIATQQVSSSSPTPPPPLDTTPTFVTPLTHFTAPLPEPLSTHIPLPTPLPVRPLPQPPVHRPLPSLPSPNSAWPALLSAVPSLSRPLFSPPTPAAPTPVCASGQVSRPTPAFSPQNDVTQPSPPESLQSSHMSSIQSSSSLEWAISPIGSASPERFSDEEIRMTLKMPSDPSGTPSGLFAFLDPPQEETSLDGAHPHSDPSPNFDFIMDFEADLDSSFEMLRDGKSCENEHRPFVEVKHVALRAAPVSTRASSMPTILEEDEQEEEDGDVTITPTEAQRALLPPDRFARPRSMSQLAGTAGASEDTVDDSLDTPRPYAQANTFSVPAQDLFDASFSLEVGIDDSQDSQDSLGQFDFLSSLMATEPTNPGFGASFDADIRAWNEAVFGESPSHGSTPSSSSSFWESTSKEESLMETSMGTGIDMQLQFPSVNIHAIGDVTDMSTEDEFLRTIMQAVQSSPKMSSVQERFELLWDASDFDL